jgi:Ca2+-binding EF-hand superfamily protein
VFRRLDGLEKADNSLSRIEFDKLVLTYRPEINSQQLHWLLSLVNVSGSGQISFDEFRRTFGTEEYWVHEVFDTIAINLSPARSGFSIEEVFRRLDGLDLRDNSLSRAEFDKVILTYKPDLNEQQRSHLFALVNTSGSGKISFHEFKQRFDSAMPSRSAIEHRVGPMLVDDPFVCEVLGIVAAHLNKAKSMFSIEEIFRRLDGLDKTDNYLSQSEFVKLVTTYVPKLSTEQLARLFSSVNVSGSGRFSFVEFKRAFGLLQGTEVAIDPAPGAQHSDDAILAGILRGPDTGSQPGPGVSSHAIGRHRRDDVALADVIMQGSGSGRKASSAPSMRQYKDDAALAGIMRGSDGASPLSTAASTQAPALSQQGRDREDAALAGIMEGTAA